MKKLLGIIGAIGLTTTGTSNIVACNTPQKENNNFEYDKDGPIYAALKTSGQNVTQDIVILDYWLGPNIEKLKVAQEYYRVNKEDKADNKENHILASHVGTVDKIPSLQTINNNLIKNLKEQYDSNNNDEKNNYITLAFARINNKNKVSVAENGDLFQTEPVKLKIVGDTYYAGIKLLSNNKLSNIAIAGIAIGSVAGVAFVVLGSCYLYQYLNKKKKTNKAETN